MGERSEASRQDAIELLTELAARLDAQGGPASETKARKVRHTLGKLAAQPENAPALR